MEVNFKNSKTGEVKSVKCGWSWTCFLFSGFFGLPLFLRGLNVWGSIMGVLFVINLIFNYSDAVTEEMFFVVFFLALGLEIFFGIKANEMTAKNYLERGWQMLEAESDIVKIAKNKWGITI